MSRWLAAVLSAALLVLALGTAAAVSANPPLSLQSASAKLTLRRADLYLVLKGRLRFSDPVAVGDANADWHFSIQPTEVAEPEFLAEWRGVSCSNSRRCEVDLALDGMEFKLKLRSGNTNDWRFKFRGHRTAFETVIPQGLYRFTVCHGAGTDRCSFGLLAVAANQSGSRGIGKRFLCGSCSPDSCDIRRCEPWTAQTDPWPPDPPTELSAVVPWNCTQVNLSWTASVDQGSGVAGYQLFRNGELYANLGSELTFVDENVSPGGSHQYELLAFDQVGNLSLPSVSTLVSIPSECGVLPPSPQNARLFYLGCRSVSITFDPNSSATGNDHYRLYRNGVHVENRAGDQLPPLVDNRFTRPGRVNTYTVTFVDAAGVESAHSNPVTVETPPCQPTLGPLVYDALLVRFADRTGPPPFSKSTAEELMYAGATSFAAWANETSYGRFSIEGSVRDWKTIGDPEADYGCAIYVAESDSWSACNRLKIRQDAIAAFDPEVDFSAVESVDVVVDGMLGGWAGVIVSTGEGQVLATNEGADFFARGYSTLAHEMGHSLPADLKHAGALKCLGAQVAPDFGDLHLPSEPLVEAGDCTWLRYGDANDPMGVSPRQYSAYNKSLLGWLDPDQHVVVSGEAELWLELLETPSSGVKELRIPIEGEDDAFYSFEYRRPLGVDALDESTLVVDGVLVRAVLSRRPWRDADGQLSGGDSETLLVGVAVPVEQPSSASARLVLDPGGAVFEDPYRGIRVEVTERNDAAARLRVTRFTPVP